MESPVESTEKWAATAPDFMASIRRLLCCAKCGEFLSGGPHKPRKVLDLGKPSMHFLCDDCFDALPD